MFHHNLCSVSSNVLSGDNMERKSMLVIGLAALLVFGLVLAVDAAQGMRQEKKGGFHGGGFMFGLGEKPVNKTAMFNDLGLPENATHEQVMDARWQKRLADLGLTEDSTIKEYREAMKAKMQEKQGQMLEEMKENLGLPADATVEQVREAMKENKPDHPCMEGRRGHKFGQ